ncbi:hypothetical protein [Natrinema sp. CBA1119]|uniref:hypothetical protein n=1 Tax=Natrinema sp. CBA1119 TaxID=1608465 RepID=UPI00159BBAA7
MSNSFFTIRTSNWSGAAWPIAVSLPKGIADDVPRIEQGDAREKQGKGDDE